MRESALARSSGAATWSRQQGAFGSRGATGAAGSGDDAGGGELAAGGDAGGVAGAAAGEDAAAVSIVTGDERSGVVGSGTGTAPPWSSSGREARSVSEASGGAIAVARRVRAAVVSRGADAAEAGDVPPSGSGIVDSTRSASADGPESVAATLGAGVPRGGSDGVVGAGTGVVEAGGGALVAPCGTGAQPASNSAAASTASPSLMELLVMRGTCPPWALLPFYTSAGGHIPCVLAPYRKLRTPSSAARARADV
jgi:hypothetical protein